jgi:aminopeptidase N
MLLAALLLTQVAQQDLRAAYDVDTYRLDLQVDPETSTLTGQVTIVAKVTKGPLQSFVFDLDRNRWASKVTIVTSDVTPTGELTGKSVPFIRSADRVFVRLPVPPNTGDTIKVMVDYSAKPDPNVRGISFAKTPDGQPWITTSCQVAGAQSWWPCKGENEHPEDKFAHLYMNVTVPKGLFAVCNGKMTGRKVQGDKETFNWEHDYPCENYAVALNVAPYVETTTQITLPGIEKPVTFSYYVLEQDLPKAKLQFTDVQGMLEAYGEAFGPFPYPDSKFALVQTPFWGMEHSTVVAYGNSFPKWIAQHGGTDNWAARNVFFDYILIHEVAHEWWGNAVSAKDWGHLWIHEGFGTYAEAVYVEKTKGREAADTYLATLRWRLDPNFIMFRGAGVLPSQAFNNNVYYKGAWVLNTLRYYVNDDAAWWRSLREFNMRFRYKNAVTEDFQAVVEEVTGKKWDRFFKEWFYQPGCPLLEGRVSVEGNKIVVNVDNSVRNGREFHVPLELSWSEGGQRKSQRVELAPGPNHIEIATTAAPTGLQLPTTHRLLADTRIAVG